MAPRKDKIEKVNTDEAPNVILNYLKEQKRPYAAQDVFANLHGKIPKAQCQKILNSLAEQNLIVTRTAGKQTVYHAHPPMRETKSQAEIDAQDEQIRTLQEEVAALKAEEKSLKAQIAALDKVAKVSELEAELEKQEAANTELEARIAEAEAKSEPSFTPEEARDVKRKWNEYRRRANEEKEIFKYVWDMFVESLPDGKTAEELQEELGIEMDES